MKGSCKDEHALRDILANTFIKLVKPPAGMRAAALCADSAFDITLTKGTALVLQLARTVYLPGNTVDTFHANIEEKNINPIS